tara:strand:- start:5189 stop:5461 length:273 start_codon:yes stop_codon:yes gene_type:complete
MSIQIPCSLGRSVYQTGSLILTIWAAKQWFHSSDPQDWNRCFDSLSDILEMIESFMDDDSEFGFLSIAKNYNSEDELIEYWQKYFVWINQ